MATIRKQAAFKKVFLYIIFPLLLCVIVISILNYRNFKQYETFSNSSKNKDVYNEIVNAVEFQDLALSMIEGEIENKLKSYSNRLVNEILPRFGEIEKLDLNKIRVILKMDTVNEDIYIINKTGTIVNTTFKRDMNLNLSDFGEKHKQLILELFNRNEFKSERFTIEATTNRLKKYCYQPTNDGNYLIEIGVYSTPADETVHFITRRLSELSRADSRLRSVDIFISADHPFSLNKDVRLDTAHYKHIQKAIETRDKQKLSDDSSGKNLEYEFIYIPRKNTELYKDAVIRIVSDKSDEAQVYFFMLASLIIFCVVLFLCIVLFYIQLYRHHESLNPYH